MKFSMIKELKSMVGDEWRDLVTAMAEHTADIEAGNYRFIHENDIDKIMQEELASDEYVLGCFNPTFLQEAIGIDNDVIFTMQNADACEAVGKLIISLGKLERVQELYARYDGYGHHFGHYNGECIELGDYYGFKVN